MIVTWQDKIVLPDPDSYPLPDDYVVPRPAVHTGEVIGCVRHLGQSFLVVARGGDGQIVEVEIERCRRADVAANKKEGGAKS